MSATSPFVCLCHRLCIFVCHRLLICVCHFLFVCQCGIEPALSLTGVQLLTQAVGLCLPVIDNLWHNFSPSARCNFINYAKGLFFLIQYHQHIIIWKIWNPPPCSIKIDKNAQTSKIEIDHLAKLLNRNRQNRDWPPCQTAWSSSPAADYERSPSPLDSQCLRSVPATQSCRPRSFSKILKSPQRSLRIFGVLH